MKRFFIIIFCVILIIIFINNFYQKINTDFNLTTSNYKTIKKDINEKYLGKGQEKIENEDGYFTTFTTIEENKKIYKEYKQNGNASWKNNEYWGGKMEDTGCGITVMAIILSGYEKNYTPEDLRKKYYPVINYDNLSNELSDTYNIKNSDFYYDSVHLSKQYIINHLNTNRPIIICVWNKPTENRWTTDSHYMALLATDNKDMVYVSNPNRRRK